MECVDGEEEISEAKLATKVFRRLQKKGYGNTVLVNVPKHSQAKAAKP